MNYNSIIVLVFGVFTCIGGVYSVYQLYEKHRLNYVSVPITLIGLFFAFYFWSKDSSGKGKPADPPDERKPGIVQQRVTLINGNDQSVICNLFGGKDTMKLDSSIAILQHGSYVFNNLSSGSYYIEFKFDDEEYISHHIDTFNVPEGDTLFKFYLRKEAKFEPIISEDPGVVNYQSSRLPGWR